MGSLAWWCNKYDFDLLPRGGCNLSQPGTLAPHKEYCPTSCPEPETRPALREKENTKVSAEPSNLGFKNWVGL